MAEAEADVDVEGATMALAGLVLHSRVRLNCACLPWERCCEAVLGWY